jgi:hypothetical protein
MSTVHLAAIQREFVAFTKEARDWNRLSLEEQRAYLKRHPGSKRRLTGKSKGKRVERDEKKPTEDAIAKAEMKQNNEQNKFKMFTQMAMLKKLVGKKVKAFGKKGKGIWGQSDDEQEYVIKDIKWETGVESSIKKGDDDSYKAWAPIRVYLEGYRASEYGLVYTDKTFLKSVEELIKKEKALEGFDLAYTEQGMQGNNYVSMDVQARKELRPKFVFDE